MKIGILSDIHGNAQALRNILDQMRQMEVDRIYFLGDAVGYLPWEYEVLDLLRTERIRCIQGNHDAMLLGALPLNEAADRICRISQARRRLSSENRDFIRSWPDCRELTMDGHSILFVHGSPDHHLTEYVHADGNFSFTRRYHHHIFFMGHTHRPFIHETADGWAINVGSCGLPRDQGNLSAFAVYETRSRSVNVFRTLFDPSPLILDENRINLSPEVIGCLNRRCNHPFGIQLT